MITDTFFSLLVAGLWEQRVDLCPNDPVDFDALYKIAEDQAVVGLIAAGLEHVEDRKFSKKDVLLFMKRVFSLENRNSAMNSFIANIADQMRIAGIGFVLIKGQGIATCYSRPEWRAAGDVDFLFDEKSFSSAKSLLGSLAKQKQPLEKNKQHLGLTITPWEVELHGNLHTGISRRIDRVLDDLQKAAFGDGRFVQWDNGGYPVLLLNPDDNAVFVFTHFLKHFYKGGLGLRQICDWCRLLWCYRDTIDRPLLERRLHEMRLITEWKAFAAFAVGDLGMPDDAMPLYDSSRRWSRKAFLIRSFILEMGNFGHNRDMSYYKKYSFLIRKAISLRQRIGDSFRHVALFPLDSLRFFSRIVFNGFRLAAKGE